MTPGVDVPVVPPAAEVFGDEPAAGGDPEQQLEDKPLVQEDPRESQAGGDASPPKKERKIRQKVKRKTMKGSGCGHNIFTHFPMDHSGKCGVCNDAKSSRAQCRTKAHGKPDDLPEPTAFAERVTADTMILNEADESREEDKVVTVIQDRHTSWLGGYPSKTKNTQDTKLAFERFSGPGTKIRHVYTDNSKEFKLALEELNIDHDTSTPYRPQTNGVAERCVRRVKEGTSCSLVQSGLS